MRIDEALREATQRLKNLPDGDGRRDARVLLASLIGDFEILYREPEKELKPDEASKYWEWVGRRAKREPVSHIIGSREFYSRDFKVSANVLDPRPDSETLVDAVLSRLGADRTDLSILDLGTGSGCLLITLLLELENSSGLGVDISADALHHAKENAELLQVSNRSAFVESKWFAAIEGKYDVIVSNPPYIESAVIETLQPEVRNFEPHLALDGGTDGLECYRKILTDIDGYLNADGLVVFEIGQGQEQALTALMEAAGFSEIQQHKDLSSIVRNVSGKLKV